MTSLFTFPSQHGKRSDAALRGSGEDLCGINHEVHSQASPGVCVRSRETVAGSVSGGRRAA